MICKKKRKGFELKLETGGATKPKNKNDEFPAAMQENRRIAHRCATRSFHSFLFLMI